MTYIVKPLPFKPNRLNGLSVRLLESHYENNYGGAVRRLNAIATHLDQLDWATASVFEINGLKREALIASGSMILHEVYFDSLGGPGGDPQDTQLKAALERSFGSLTSWRAEFIAMGKALGGGSGWVLMSWSERLGRLVNQWASDHAHSLPGGTPLLALDMYEHAYHLDFGANAGAYVNAFMQNINWEGVAERYDRVIAPQTDAAMVPHDLDSAELTALLQQAQRSPLVFDVRLADDYANGRNRLPDAPWRDPQHVADWASELPQDTPIVVYCKYGGWVSQDTAEALRQQGLDARSLGCGISAWRAMGHPTMPLEDV
ncbi:MAG: hypothetical protein ETSY2_48495 [Candidatus Entotheonella gemina]|uniref:superoxide dismutase n=1 Tax=Candidatus Entotheonella gemina TaxID=1429439 RepID=W4LB33_9BACT|nr:MAG: hypothetical protein ETSY2_48495 [Candidatus Entotheonella gemina]